MKERIRQWPWHEVRNGFTAGALAVAIVLLVLALRTLGGQSTSIKTLLLNGKTASAISGKATAKEVQLLLTQQQAFHDQTVRGQHTLNVTVERIESHLDLTIRRAFQASVVRGRPQRQAQLEATIVDGVRAAIEQEFAKAGR